MIPFKNRWLNLCVAVVAIAASHFLFVNKQSGMSAEKMASIVSSELQKKYTMLDQQINSLKEKMDEEGTKEVFSKSTQEFQQLYSTKGTGLFLYKNDSLQLWSTNQIPVPTYIETIDFSSSFLKLKNGWYAVEQSKTTYGNLVALALIQHDYPYQNQYLQNDFQHDFSIGKLAKIMPLNSAEGKVVIGKNDGPLFRIVAKRGKSSASNIITVLLVILSALGVYFFVVFLLQECLSLKEHIGKKGSIFLFAISIIALRATMLLLKQPTPIYNLLVFSPNQYAMSSFLPSLGDLLLHAICIIGLVALAHKYTGFKKIFTVRASQIGKAFFASIFFVFAFLLSITSIYVIHSLIENSNISFNVNNLFELNTYSYVAIGIIGIFFFATFLLIDKAVKIAIKLSTTKRFLGLSIAIPFLLLTVIAFKLFSYPEITIALPIAIVAIVYIVKKNGAKSYSFPNIIVLLLLFSLFAAYFISVNSNAKEKKERLLLIEKISEEEDPVAELLFDELFDGLQKDKLLHAELDTSVEFNKEKFDKQLLQQYFNGYFSRYSLNSYVFLANGTALAPSDADKRKHKKEYFQNLIRNYGHSTLNNNFYHIANPEETETYLAKVLIRNAGPSIHDAVIYIAFESKLIPEEIGFPDLLLDSEEGYGAEFKKYSFAKYENNKLVGQYGKYRYPMTNYRFNQSVDKKHFTDFENYSHLIYNSEEGLPADQQGHMVILSHEKEGYLADITKFSYLFGFFSILLLVILVGKNISKGIEVHRFTVTAKVQLMMVLVILTSLVLFGIGTSYYINIQYAEKNNKNIREKISSVLIEVEHKLGEEDKISDDINYMHYILAKFSSVFFTDINLYDLNGNLLASSRPQLFSEGLLSQKMNTAAFAKMNLQRKSQYVHQESIGSLTYLSAYVPFKNQSGEVLAYLNLPYFAKQSELESEISSFLVALINIYVFLFALSIIAALFISNIITEPLRFLQNRLSKVELGKTNSPIQYDGEDEIGSLIKVYNEKVLELQQSAELLAKSERESAWREMAKQVAHEIKNPLTPMKLSVQHLQRSLSQNQDDFKERIERFSSTLIEQIDSLSSIATAFSDFAKMPTAQNQVIDIKHTLLSAIDLFEETPNIVLKFENFLIEDKKVYADKDQLLRVFNNLLKNAIQAIPEDQEGKIIVRLSEEKNYLMAEIEDNGSGINKEKLDKIFVPSFTTKTSGMGLGLAMVKNIIDNMNGSIWFETQEGKGTTFYVKIPEYTKAD